MSENVRDFLVAEEDGCVIGCGALHLYGMHLAEIRSIAVLPARKGSGVGRLLVEALNEESRRHHVSCLCLFTRTPGFFGHLGFEISRRLDLPDKIYKDCVHCPKLMDCDEIAMIMGQLPPNTNGPRPEYFDPHHSAQSLNILIAANRSVEARAWVADRYLKHASVRRSETLLVPIWHACVMESLRLPLRC